VVYGTALEKRPPLIAERGFKSRPLRHKILGYPLPYKSIPQLRRGAGVADQARLESVCSRKATVGSNPTLSAILFSKVLTNRPATILSFLSNSSP
jgi:hypothetical protein